MQTKPQSNTALERMRRFFVQGEETTGDPQAGRSAHQSRDIDPSMLLFSQIGVTNAEFKSRVEILKAKGCALISGRLHFLNLKAIKERAGEKWPRLATSVHGITQSILSHHMDDEDFFFIVSDHTYLTVFPKLSEDEAKTVCVNIAQQVMERLLGKSADLAEVDLRVAVTEVDGKMSFEKVDLFDALDDAFESSGELLIDAALFDRNTPNLRARGDAGLKKLMAAEGSPLQFDPKLGDVAATLSGKDPKTNGAGNGSRSPEMGWFQEDQDLSDWTESLEAAQDGPELQVSYSPLWQTGNNLVSGNWASLYIGIEGVTYLGESLIPDDAAPSLVAAYDRYVLATTIEDAMEKVGARKMGLFVVPAHLSTLRRIETGGEYLAHCNAIPDSLRRYLVWEVIYGKSDAPNRAVHEAMKRFCRTVVCRVPEDWSYFSALANTEAHGFGFNFELSDLSDFEIMTLLNNSVRMAKRLKMRTFATGLHSKGRVAAAASSGVDYLCGEGVTAANAKPQPVRPLALSELGIPIG